MITLPLVWLLLFNARHSSAARIAADTNSENGALVAEIGQHENGFPECFEVAKLTYPGGCNPKKSAFACYSTEKVYRPTQTDPAVKVQWACSKEFDTTDISMDACPAREWHFDGEVDKKHLKFAAPAGIYAGACQFSVLPESQGESPQVATTPEQLSAVATTPEHTVPDATTPSQTATTPESPKAATTPEQLSAVATTPEHTVPDATTPSQTATTPESPKAATTPEQLSAVATTPEHTVPDATTPSQTATTPENEEKLELDNFGDQSTIRTKIQPHIEHGDETTAATTATTMKNGVACKSVGSLLTTVLGLGLYHLQ